MIILGFAHADGKLLLHDSLFLRWVLWTFSIVFHWTVEIVRISISRTSIEIVIPVDILIRENTSIRRKHPEIVLRLSIEILHSSTNFSDLSFSVKNLSDFFVLLVERLQLANELSKTESRIKEKLNQIPLFYFFPLPLHFMIQHFQSSCDFYQVHWRDSHSIPKSHWHLSWLLQVIALIHR